MKNKRKALVTGGCGFVGRHFTCRLVKDEYDVTVVDDLSTGLQPSNWPTNTYLSNDIKFYHADVIDYCRNTTENFDLVIHLAAVVEGRKTIDGDPLRVAKDLAIDSVLFNWLVKSKPKPKKVVYFSSSAAYPEIYQIRTNHYPLSEDMISFVEKIGVPDMTYGWSKLSGEYLAKFATENYDLSTAIYRPFSGYGEDQSFDYPFPSIVKRAMETKPPMIVWGSGEQSRDFIHIDDIVEAVMLTKGILESFEPLNLGTGKGITFKELAKKCLNIVGRDIEIECDISKPEGSFYRVANIERMLKYYTPKIILDEGIKRTVEYFSKMQS